MDFREGGGGAWTGPFELESQVKDWRDSYKLYEKAYTD